MSETRVDGGAMFMGLPRSRILAAMLASTRRELEGWERNDTGAAAGSLGCALLIFRRRVEALEWALEMAEREEREGGVGDE